MSTDATFYKITPILFKDLRKGDTVLKQGVTSSIVEILEDVTAEMDNSPIKGVRCRSEDIKHFLK